MLLTNENKWDYSYSKLLNLLMYDGKKNIARNIVKKSFEKALKKTGASSNKELFLQALLNISPDIQIKSKRVGSSVYQVPIPLEDKKRLNLGIRFLLSASRSRKEYSMIDRLSNELIDAYLGKGIAIKKKDDIHKMGEANKAFAHFNW